MPVPWILWKYMYGIFTFIYHKEYPTPEQLPSYPTPQLPPHLGGGNRSHRRITTFQLGVGVLGGRGWIIRRIRPHFLGGSVGLVGPLSSRSWLGWAFEKFGAFFSKSCFENTWDVCGIPKKNKTYQDILWPACFMQTKKSRSCWV